MFCACSTTPVSFFPFLLLSLLTRAFEFELYIYIYLSIYIYILYIYAYIYISIIYIYMYMYILDEVISWSFYCNQLFLLPAAYLKRFY